VALEKAKIIVERSNRQQTIEVLFNPNEYTIQMANTFKWHKVPGLSVPIGKFISGDGAKLNMDLFFDTYEKGIDVRNYSSQVANLLNVDKDLHAPPICKFVWGPMSFRGVLVSVTQKFTMFLDSGTPVRAKLSVAFHKCQSVEEQFRETPRQSSDRTKQRTLKQGEHLWMIAGEEYEDPRFWRAIARANGIDNPRVLEPGMRLTIPPLE